MKFDVKTIEAAKAGTVELSDAIFGLDPRVDLIHRVIQWQLNKRQQGTHQAKSRSEINRTTHKLGNQKGGGTARHGSRKAGIFVGGGKAFGPRFRSHETSLNKKVRALGLRHALSAKVKSSELIVLDKAEVKNAKTKEMKVLFEKLGWTNALIIDGATVNEGFAAAGAAAAAVKAPGFGAVSGSLRFTASRTETQPPCDPGTEPFTKKIGRAHV